MTTTPTRILCPVDFSDASERALRYAVAAARWYGAAVHVLHVRPMLLTPVALGPFVEPPVPVVMSEPQRAQLDRSLAQFARDASLPGVVVTTTLVEDVNVAGAILSFSEEMHADLVVIGTQGHSGLGRLILGSVAERVLRKASCPVLTVPPGAPRALADTSAVRHVLCPVDFSASSAAALRWASVWAARAGERLTAIHIAELLPEAPLPPSEEYAAYRQALIDNASRTLAGAVAEAIPSTARVEQEVVVGTPAVDILRLAGERHVDLIVMGVRGRGAVDLAVFGSTTQQVVRRASCPVLAVHPAAVQRPDAPRPDGPERIHCEDRIPAHAARSSGLTLS
jgi:nucleotide-binding universal stress UspA family protein